jgi:hypothetical protein
MGLKAVLVFWHLGVVGLSPELYAFRWFGKEGGLRETVPSSIRLVGLATGPANVLWLLLFGPSSVDQGFDGPS